MPKVTVYTQVYNAERYVKQCIRSVLNQTFTDFEYIVVDSASTDGSSEILDALAKEDPRIRLIRLQENQPYAQFNITEQYATGKYYASIDHDDWWEPNYIERLLAFIEDFNLDLAMTGTVSYFEATHAHSVLRKVDVPLVFTLHEFAQRYPQFWAFPSTRWASLMPLSLFLKLREAYVWGEESRLDYGGDTVFMLDCLNNCRRIGIDNSALYHYRIHKASQTFQYNVRRFDANIICYQSIFDFLRKNGSLDNCSKDWLKRVHLSSMTTTLERLAVSSLSEEEKLQECTRIIAHPLTKEALLFDCPERVQWYNQLKDILYKTARSDSGTVCKLWSGIVHFIAPNCYKAVTQDTAGLFAREPALLPALLEDDRNTLAEKLLDLIAEKRYVKQYEIGGMLQDLLPENSPLYSVENKKFFGKYPKICKAILENSYMYALDLMAEQLLTGKRLYAEETFLQVFLVLAALENQPSVFIFGKVRLAKLYLYIKQPEKYLSVLTELEEMGLGENEIITMRQALEADI